MTIEFQIVLPEEIEARSMQMISEELGNAILDPEQEPVIKRVIHTSADFEYLHNLVFSENAVAIAKQAIRDGAHIVTDTRMASVGVNAARLAKFGGQVHCFMADADVAAKAKLDGSTRATVCMQKAAELDKPVIIAIGNAPTALIELYKLIKEQKIKPALIIGVPVGFVNVVESKELIMRCGIPYIVARGRKGGSNVAAAICNALIYNS